MAMAFMGQIVEVTPGTGPQPGDSTSRPDWSPQAQAPDPTTGVMAHTPDPLAYHDAGGRTMVPRSKGIGLSRGFDANRPGIVNIDPSDPVRGTGGLSIDMEKLTKQSVAAAADQAGGNPALAWAIAGQQQVAPHQVEMPAPVARVAPEGQTGYVVPSAAIGGAQVQPQQLPAAAALGGTAELFTHGVVTNPSVKPLKGRSMPQPQTVPMPSVAMPSVAMPSVQMPVVPHPQTAIAPPVMQAVPPVTFIPQPIEVPQAAPQVAYQPPQPQYPAQPDPAQAAMLQALGGIMNQLEGMKTASVGNGQFTGTGSHGQVEPQEAFEVERAALESEKRELTELRNRMIAEGQRPLVAEPEPDDSLEATLSTPEDCDLPFLTDPVSKPSVQVIFNLGVGGQHYKRFHHIAVSDMWLSMIYDTRYEGDQFIPPVTREGDPPIRITFPQDQNKMVDAIVPNGCHMRIGCLDIINFIIVPAGQQGTPDNTMTASMPIAPDQHPSAIMGQGVREQQIL